MISSNHANRPIISYEPDINYFIFNQIHLFFLYLLNSPHCKFIQAKMSIKYRQDAKSILPQREQNQLEKKMSNYVYVIDKLDTENKFLSEQILYLLEENKQLKDQVKRYRDELYEKNVKPELYQKYGGSKEQSRSQNKRESIKETKEQTKYQQKINQNAQNTISVQKILNKEVHKSSRNPEQILTQYKPEKLEKSNIESSFEKYKKPTMIEELSESNFKRRTITEEKSSQNSSSKNSKSKRGLQIVQNSQKRQSPSQKQPQRQTPTQGINQKNKSQPKNDERSLEKKDNIPYKTSSNIKSPNKNLYEKHTNQKYKTIFSK